MTENITTDMLDGFYPKTRLFGQHGRGINISIDLIVCPVRKIMWFEFSSNRCVVYTGPNLEEAISLYNKAKN